MSANDTDDPLRVMQRMFDEGFATGNGAVAEELCAPDMIDHQFGLAGTGAEAIEHVKAAMADVHSAFPDVIFTMEDSATVHGPRGDMVWVRAHGHGTNTGPFFGPPTDREVDFTVIDVARVVNGRIIEHWGVPDRFALLAQTGVLDRLAGPPSQGG